MCNSTQSGQNDRAQGGQNDRANTGAVEIDHVKTAVSSAIAILYPSQTPSQAIQLGWCRTWQRVHFLAATRLARANEIALIR
ncbi:MAG: hypothetical protein ACAF41_12300 [Leptolyngbya sp. BL-A-14]